MANVKISGLPAASSVVGTNEFEINEAGTSKKVTGSQIAAYANSLVSTNSISQGNTSVTATDTGTDGKVVINTEGTDRVTVDSSGNVGIGKSDPAVRLDVEISDDTNIQSVTRVRNLTGATRFQLSNLDAQGSNANANNWDLFIGNNGQRNFNIWDNFAGPRLTILGDGNVGIGTSSPVGKFNVIGGIGVGTLTGDNAVTPPTGAVVMAGGSYSAVQTYASPGNATVVGLLQNYLITSDFSRYLDIAALGSTGGAGANIRFLTGSDTATERMRITSGGDVGIGLTSPSTKLDVDGQISGKFTDVGTNTAAQALATNHVSQVTISANTTLTTTVPPAGSQAIVIIVSSGATSRTVTFGTGFASTGTLATGATTDRRFVVSFVSDGTRLLECSRTAAITV